MAVEADVWAEIVRLDDELILLLVREIRFLRGLLFETKRRELECQQAYHAALDLLVIERVTADQLWRRTLEQRDAIAELRAAPAPRRTGTDG